MKGTFELSFTILTDLKWVALTQNHPAVRLLNMWLIHDSALTGKKTTTLPPPPPPPLSLTPFIWGSPLGLTPAHSQHPRWITRSGNPHPGKSKMSLPSTLPELCMAFLFVCQASGQRTDMQHDNLSQPLGGGGAASLCNTDCLSGQCSPPSYQRQSSRDRKSWGGGIKDKLE